MGKAKKFPYERDQGRVLVEPAARSTFEIRGHLVDDEEDAGAIIVASWVEVDAGKWVGEEMYRISPNIAAGLRVWFRE